MAFHRWMYRGTRPNVVARLVNRLSAVLNSGAFARKRDVTLEVRGRKTGKVTSFPLAIADYQGDSYVVAMLGDRTNWARNVRHSQGRAVLRRGHRGTVLLIEVEADARAPILRRYLAVAPAARPHFPVHRHAPLSEFAKIAADYPVFRVTTAPKERAGSS